MGFDIEGHKFIVTGAANGIGLAISRRLSELGAKVSGWDLYDDAMASDPAFTHSVKVDAVSYTHLTLPTKRIV